MGEYSKKVPSITCECLLQSYGRYIVCKKHELEIIMN